jgi:transposase
MLLVGVDWAETQHAACLMDQRGATVQRLTLPHTPAGPRRLHHVVAAVESDPATVLVAIERPDGLRVEAVLAAGSTVYAFNPKAVERYRGRTRTTGATSDPADAELLARILLTDRDRHRPLEPSSPHLEEVRALARQNARASRDQRRLLNRLRQDLLTVFPAARSAFPDLSTVSALAFLEHWPTADLAACLSVVEVETFLRQQRHGQPRQAAARSHAAVQEEALVAPPQLGRATTGGIQLAVQQRRLLYRQRAAWEARLRTLLVGAEGRPDGEILVSLPGLDVRLAARVLGEIGDRRTRFPTPTALQCDAGTAPVTTTPGRSRIVSTRWACNRFLRQALLRWACCSVPRSPWARAFYYAHRAARQGHFQVVRARPPLAGDPAPAPPHRPARRRGSPSAQSLQRPAADRCVTSEELTKDVFFQS